MSMSSKSGKRAALVLMVTLALAGAPLMALPGAIGGKTEDFSDGQTTLDYQFPATGGELLVHVKIPALSTTLSTALTFSGSKLPEQKTLYYNTDADFATGTYVNVSPGQGGLQRDPHACRFNQMVSHPAGAGVYYLAVGDVNSDGRADVVVTNYGANSTGVFHQKSDGTLDVMDEMAVGAYPDGVAIGDVNNDGRNDIVVAGVMLGGAGVVSVFNQTATGTFDPRADYWTGGYPDGIAIGDISADGKKDIVVACWASGVVGVLQQNPLGGFYPNVNWTVGTNPRGIACGDLTGDGKDDVAVSLWFANQTKVLIQTTPGQLTQNYTIDGGYNPIGLALGDVNGDSRLDIVQACSLSNYTGVILQKPDGTLTNQFAYTGSLAQPFAVATGDVNNDNLTDFLCTNTFQNSDRVDVYAQDISRQRKLLVTLTAGDTPTGAGIGDLNGDGLNDIAVANRGSGTIGVFAQKPFEGHYASAAPAATINILKAMPTWGQTARGNPVQIELSNDNGAHWTQATNATEMTFASAGNNITFRATFTSASSLDWMLLNYTLDTVYPSEITMDIGNDGTIDWTSTGQLISGKTIPDLSARITSYVLNHTADADVENNVSVPIKIRSATAGIMTLAGLLFTFNVPPVVVDYLPKGNPINTNEGDTLNFSVTAADYDLNTLSYLWTVDGVLQSGATNQFAYRPDYNAAGNHNLTVQVSDGKAFTYRTWDVKVRGVNRHPEITAFNPAADPSVKEGQNAQFHVTMTELDGDNLTVEWFLDGLRVVQTSSSESGFVYNATYLDAGAHNVTVTAFDGELKVAKTWIFSVSDVNLLFEETFASPVANVSIDEGTGQEFSVSTDAFRTAIGNHSIRWGVDGIFVSSTPVFRYDTNYTSSGDHNISVQVTAGIVKFTRSWKVTVSEKTNPPYITDRTPGFDPTLREGQKQEFKVAAKDPDSDALTYKWFVNGTPAGTSDTYRYSASYTSEGWYVVRVEISDNVVTINHTWKVTVMHAAKPAPGNGGLNLMYLAVGIIAMVAVIGGVLFYFVKRPDKASRMFDRADMKMTGAGAATAPAPVHQNLPELTPPPKPKATYPCPQCNGVVEEDWFVCHHCSASLKGGKEMPKVSDGSVGRHEEKATTDAMTRSQSSVEAPSCPRCGKMLEPNWGACPQCGFVLKAAETSMAEPEAPATPACPACGAAVEAGWAMCPECGGKIAGGPPARDAPTLPEAAPVPAAPQMPEAPAGETPPSPAPNEEPPTAQPLAPDANATPPAATPLCPHCGGRVDAGWKLCPECSGKLN